MQVARTVELISRHKSSQQTYVKIFQSGHAVGIPVISRVPLSTSGTTVTVYDLFHNLPVRKRALSSSLQLEQVKCNLQAAILAYPEVSLSLLSEESAQSLLWAPRTSSSLSRFSQLFGKARNASLKPVAVQHAGMKISGLLSTQPLSSKRMQFLFVNKRLVLNPEVHALLNNLMAPVITAASRTSHQNMHPVYFITADMANTEFELCTDSTKNLVCFHHWKNVTTALTCLVATFLFNNHFSVSSIDLDNSSPKQSRTNSFPKQSRTISRSPVHVEPSRHSFGSPSNEAALSTGPVIAALEPTAPPPSINITSTTTGAIAVGRTHWKQVIDPMTKRRLLVHPTTGCTMTGVHPTPDCTPSNIHPTTNSHFHTTTECTSSDIHPSIDSHIQTTTEGTHSDVHPTTDYTHSPIHPVSYCRNSNTTDCTYSHVHTTTDCISSDVHLVADCTLSNSGHCNSPQLPKLVPVKPASKLGLCRCPSPSWIASSSIRSCSKRQQIVSRELRTSLQKDSSNGQITPPSLLTEWTNPTFCYGDQV